MNVGNPYMREIQRFDQGGGIYYGGRIDDIPPLEAVERPVDDPQLTVERAAEGVRLAQEVLGPDATNAEIEEYAMNYMKEDNSPIKVEGVDQKMVDRTVKGVADLINATLKSKAKTRFADAARLCQIGQQLMRTQATSVKDFAMLEAEDEDVADGAYAGADGGAGRFANAVRRGLVANGDADARRERLALEPAAQVERERAAAEIATNEATEMDRLTAMRERLPEAQRGALDTRITTLMTSLETRNNAQLQMVRADLPRGHAAGEGGAEGNDPPRVRVNGHGGEGANGVAQEGGLPDVGAQAVG